MMAEKYASSSVKCRLLSLPCGFLQLKENYEDAISDDESLICGLGSNTLLVNEKTARTLALISPGRRKALWVVLKLSLSVAESDENSDTYNSKRLIQVIIDDRVSDEFIILSEDFLYNLEYSCGLRNSCRITSVTKPKQLHLSCESHNECLPSKATKVILSLIQFEITLEDNFVDKALQSYFSFPRYLCKNDVFGVYIPHHNKLDSINSSNIDLIYFKVYDMEGNQSLGEAIPNICGGYLVDSSVTIYQVSNNQDLYPANGLAVSCARDLGLNEVLNNRKLLDSVYSRGHNLIPKCFDVTFQVLCKWMEPFLCGYKTLQDVELSPILLLSGPNGSGKTMLMEAVSRYFGMNYWRMDCVMIGEPVPGQVEAKLKAVFGKLNTVAPCILHFSNIQALFEDANGKDDVRVLSCFEQQIKSLKPKWPVVIMASTSNRKSMSSSVNQLFLESINVKPLNQAEREDMLSWFVDCSCGVIDKQILQAVGAQTSGFLLRDLEMLVSLSSKEKYIRSKEENSANEDYVFSDFSKIIGTMRKVFSESIGAPKVPSVSWKDVGGLEHLKKEILRSLKSNMFNTGLKRSGLLLHGPPGTGKTLLAKAVATQCGRNFLSVKGPELLNMYVGQSEHNVRDLFELAKAASPCIVFFDELDSLAPNRGRSGDSGGVMDRVVSQLLAEMDGLGSSGEVFILGATNRPDLIDPALLRPGRLDKLLYVGPCEDRASQLSVLTALTRKLTLASDVDLDQLVSRLPRRVSGAQLSAVCSAAWLASARQTIQGGEYKHDPTVVVGQNHFLAALGSALS